jgi:YidC/Oxa1 family membrane protein insertase
MFPLSIMQQKTTSKSQIFAPKLREIQTKYRGNQQKFQEEYAKLTKQGYNPAGGCLPMMVTMVILFGVLGVVYGPMTYFERIEPAEIDKIRAIAIEIEQENYLAPEEKTEENKADREYEAIKNSLEDAFRGEMRIIAVYRQYTDQFTDRGLKPETIKKLDSLTKSIVFLGIDFSRTPTLSRDEGAIFPLILIPILSFLFAVGHMIIMQRIQKKTMPDAMAQMGAMKYMLYFMPLLSLYIAFQFPAGAGFYWAISSLMMIGQSLVIHKIHPPEKLKAEIMSKLEKQGINIDTVVTIEKSDGRVVEKKASEMSGKEQKEYYRKKIEAARKADLEKYGDVGASPPQEDAPPADKKDGE